MLNVGDKLWNGLVVTPEFASRQACLEATYNALQARIDSFKAEGRTVPEHLLNGSTYRRYA
jgi:hypothetical protein